MPKVLKFKDDQYMFKGVTHTREIVRAVLLDENNNVCLEKLVDDDGFGPRDYYETPGGGIKTGESHDDALHREIAEEVGYNCEILEHIADVHDYYNLIGRKNYNHFYLVKRLEKVEQHLEPDEKIRIEKIIWVPIDEAITLYENMQNVLVGKIVKQRELPILKMAKKLIENGDF